MSSIYAFYGLIRDAVRFYPESGATCKRPNAFLVETKDGGENLRETNLGVTICDKDRNYFFSRLWEESGFPQAIEHDWPLVTVLMRESTLTKPFSVGPKISRDLFINVVDTYRAKGDCDGCDCEGCDNRGINDIYADTEVILLNILRYLGNSAVYHYEDAKYLLNRDHWAYLYSRGDLDYPEREAGMESVLGSANPTVSMYPVNPVENIYGTTARIKVEFTECLAPTMDFDVREYNLNLEHCKTCG